jgi:hypothetical protein
MPYRTPTAYISYAWESEDHKSWVKDLAVRLRSAAGVDVTLDHWGLQLGDQLPHFMERIRQSDFVLCVCTPTYKERYEARLGGVGYEANLMSAEALATGNERKFIPLLRAGERLDSLPSWLLGKYHLDFRGEPYQEASYDRLVTTLHGVSPQAPPVGAPGARPDRLAPSSIARQESYAEFFNASFKVFEQAKSRLVLLAKNNEATRILMPAVERTLEHNYQIVSSLALTFAAQSSLEVKQAAGGIAVLAGLARVLSNHPSFTTKFEEVLAQFNALLPQFIEATRKEGGLR